MPRLSASEEFRWQPEKATERPISIIMSREDWRVLVYRNGVEIGRSKLVIGQLKQTLGTHAYIMQEGLGIIGNSPILKSAPAHLWITKHS